MSKPYILVAEDDMDIGNMLRIYLSAYGYDVRVVVRGSDELETVRQRIPDVIIQDIMLPDIDGFKVCRVLHENLGTSQIPIFFLTQKDERSDRLQGMELGANDYIPKPFDIEELKFRIVRQIQRSSFFKHTHPTTGLATGVLIENQLQDLLDEVQDWAILYINILHFETFREVYGEISSNDALVFTGQLIEEVISSKSKLTDDFVGHVRDERFVVGTSEKSVSRILKNLQIRFEEEILAFYNFMDRQQGYIKQTDPDGHEVKTPFMKLAVGLAFSSDGRFSNAHEIIQFAVQNKRKKAGI